ncbi:translation initiation factor IF-2-like [Cervus elaphus]|uniref:translation initiation factor IF-2-like n=1 Tax=Cervus elaphus TaxID=9860 RepID=UPI001CC2D24E|nr:translation initiation factor IF-2-like [Cervus elaphus]
MVTHLWADNRRNDIISPDDITPLAPEAETIVTPIFQMGKLRSWAQEVRIKGELSWGSAALAVLTPDAPEQDHVGHHGHRQLNMALTTKAQAGRKRGVSWKKLGHGDMLASDYAAADGRGTHIPPPPGTRGHDRAGIAEAGEGGRHSDQQAPLVPPSIAIDRRQTGLHFRVSISAVPGGGRLQFAGEEEWGPRTFCQSEAQGAARQIGERKALLIDPESAHPSGHNAVLFPPESPPGHPTHAMPCLRVTLGDLNHSRGHPHTPPHNPVPTVPSPAPHPQTQRRHGLPSSSPADGVGALTQAGPTRLSGWGWGLRGSAQWAPCPAQAPPKGPKRAGPGGPAVASSGRSGPLPTPGLEKKGRVAAPTRLSSPHPPRGAWEPRALRRVQPPSAALGRSDGRLPSICAETPRRGSWGGGCTQNELPLTPTRRAPTPSASPHAPTMPPGRPPGSGPGPGLPPPPAIPRSFVARRAPSLGVRPAVPTFAPPAAGGAAGGGGARPPSSPGAGAPAGAEDAAAPPPRAPLPTACSPSRHRGSAFALRVRASRAACTAGWAAAGKRGGAEPGSPGRRLRSQRRSPSRAELERSERPGSGREQKGLRRRAARGRAGGKRPGTSSTGS